MRKEIPWTLKEGERKEGTMTNLKDLQKAMDEKRVYNIAIAIRKYQDFKANVAIAKMDDTLSEATKRNYFTGGVSYIKTGKKLKSVPSSIFDALDKVMSECVQPLRPSEADKKRAYKRDFCKKENIPPVARLDIVKRPLAAKVSYGVKLEDSITCVNSYDEAVGFIKGLKFMGNSKGTMVSFEGLEEVK